MGRILLAQQEEGIWRGCSHRALAQLVERGGLRSWASGSDWRGLGLSALLGRDEAQGEVGLGTQSGNTSSWSMRRRTERTEEDAFSSLFERSSGRFSGDAGELREQTWRRLEGLGGAPATRTRRRGLRAEKL